MFSFQSLLQLQVVYTTSTSSTTTSSSNSSNKDMMIPRKRALICALFLCGLQETVLSQRGRCVGNQCFALFQEPEDYPGAEKSCRDSGGELLSSLESVEKILGTVVGGSLWLQGAGRAAAAGLQECHSVSVSMERNLTVSPEPCNATLDGFLCQYTYDEPCGEVQAGGGAQVKYTTPMGFEADDSETFPPGTIALTGEVGGKYADSKHVCVSEEWKRAPWTCEVMRGGCEYGCSSVTHGCVCPAGKSLHSNQFSCTDGPCEANPCTGEGQECEATRDGFTCTCKDEFVEEDGVCVNVSICEKCEHMLCDKVSGVYRCGCRKGFRVSGHDPTKCEVICTQMDCPDSCILISGQYKCFCLDGYIEDIQDGTPFCTDIDECESNHCDHNCENTFGSYRCSCDDGFKLQPDNSSCTPVEDYDEVGSGSTPSYPTPAGAQPAVVPSYIKTGSVLGIAVFMGLCLVLLFFLIRNAFKRCGRFELTTLKHPDIDIFYLQQVTTETYKRLSFDKQFKNDS